MKYLKRFNESSNTIEDNIVEEVTDILTVELEPLDIEFQLWQGTYYPTSTIPKKSIIVPIWDKYKRFFEPKDIQNAISRLRSFLTQEYDIHLGIPRDLVYGPAEEFIKEFSGEEFYDLTIYIYKK